MDVVYAIATTSVTMPGGWTLLVEHGSHWAADDQVVIDHPDLFSSDPRYGMHRSNPNAAPQTEEVLQIDERRNARRGR